MKYLLYILLFLLPTRALAQTSDTVPFVNYIDTIAFMKEARKHFASHVVEFIDFRNRLPKKFHIKHSSIKDTANVKHIIPLYGLRDIGKYDSLSNLIYYIPEPTNQYYVIYNGIDIWTGLMAYGIESYIDKLNRDANDIVRISIDGDCSISNGFGRWGITNYNLYCALLSEHPNYQFFVVWELPDDFWAFDENKRLWHIFQENDKINIEDGEEFYQKMIEKNGIDCIKDLIYGGHCEKYIFYSPIPEKKKKKNHRAD